MSTSLIWRDDDSELELHRAEDGSLDLDDGESIITIPESVVAGLVRAMARESAPSLVPATPLAGGSFQVFYVHEYRDESGEIIECPDLGDHGGDWRFTWDESDVADVWARVKAVGEAVAAIHAARADRGDTLDEENARPWISVFRMPADERVWKGPWDELEGELDSLSQ